MAADALRSPLGSESQDEWGSGAWMEGECVSTDERGRQGHSVPQEQGEHIHSDPAEQEQEVTEEELPPPPPPSIDPCMPVGGAAEPHGSPTHMDDSAGQQDWPPMPALMEAEGRDSVRPPPPMDQMLLDQGSESHEDSDSIVFLSENSEEEEEIRINSKPLNFTSTRDEWVRRDSGSMPTSLVYSRSFSNSLITEATQTDTEPRTHQRQQVAPWTHSPPHHSENQEVQQVCKSAPPLETVAGETANPELGSPTCSSIVALREAAGRREGERESEQTDSGRKQTVSGSDRGQARGECGRGLGHLEKEDQTEEAGLASQRSQGGVRMYVDPFDDSQSDSGVSADFSPNGSAEMNGTPALCSFTDSPQPPANETPIEKEIRLAVKREQSLRRSRGMDTLPDKTKEFVEIPLRRAILSQKLPAKSEKSHYKDRHLAGKKMQHEIQLEAEREKDLVKLGRLPGFYDKGTARQLYEKKLLFEAFQEPKEDLTIQSTRPSSVSSYDVVDAAAHSNTTLASSKKRTRSLELLNPRTSPPQRPRDTNHSQEARGPRLSEAVRGQVIIVETTPSPGHVSRSQQSTASTSTKSVDTGRTRSYLVEPHRDRRVTSRTSSGPRDSPDSDDDEEESAMVKENPFFKLRSSLSHQPDVQRDIQQAREREREFRKQRSSLYGGAGAQHTTSPNTHSTSYKSTPEQRSTTKTRTVRQSLGKLDLTWPPPAHHEHEDQFEAQKSPKGRQKSLLVQRWESSLVNGHSDEED